VKAGDAVTRGRVVRIPAGQGTELVKVCKTMRPRCAAADLVLIEVERQVPPRRRIWINSTQVLGVLS
jgi:hypothetical protein